MAEMIERIKEVMKDPERIRNVATSSHVHHGKCIHPESLVMLVNEVDKAKKMFEKYRKKGKIIKNNKDEIIVDVRDLNLETYSFNPKTYLLERKRITHIWKLKHEGKLIKIIFADNKEIITTPEHKFFVFDKEKNKIIEKEAINLSINDLVISPRYLVFSEIDLKDFKEFLLEKLAQDYGFTAYLSENLTKKLHSILLKMNFETIWKKINSKLSYKSFYHCIWNGRYRLKDLVLIAKLFEISLTEIYDNIDFIKYIRRIKRFGSKTSSKIFLPKTSQEWEELFYLFGLISGNGSFNLKFDNKNEKLREKVLEISSKILKLKPIEKRYKGKYIRIYLNGDITLKKFLKILLNYPFKSKAKNLEIPNYFFILPKKWVENFIRGLFDADTSVHQTAYLSSASKRFLQKLQLLLLRFGCLSHIREKTVKLNGKEFKEFILYISSRSELESFSKIGFYVDYMNEKLIGLFKNSGFSKIYYYEIPQCLRCSSIFDNVVILKISKIEKIDYNGYVYDFSVEDLHNFVANGIFVHNTTLTDNLMAGAGMLAEELAGKIMYTWFDEQERERQLTIYGANVSMIHNYKGKDYLINLVDTPGHVDFGGDVTRAMRAVDGTIVLICAVEGIMPQTETVFRQALRERVKPVLFINKVDRLIKEVKLTPQQMLERFERLIKEVNLLIQKYAEEQFRNKWYVNVQNGSVAFGSAKQRWAISLPYMQETGITFKDIIDMVLNDQQEELAKKAPLHKVVLDMIIRHLPSPKEAIKYRLEKIWPGDLSSEYGKDMLEVNPNGKLAAIVTKVIPDPHVGFVATARIFSGKIYKGKDVYLVSNQKTAKVQQVAIYKGIQRIPVDEVLAGNIVAIVGIPEAFTGETLCEADSIITPFVEIKHIFEPVVTKAIEPKNPQDLTKLVETLQKIAKEDSVLKVKINVETGEYLVSGLGELHIEAKVERKLKEMGFDVIVSNPIVVYKEVVKNKNLNPIEAKSPNKHNRFYIVVEPLEESIYQAFINDELPEHIYLKTKKDPKLIEKLIKLGMDREDAKNVVAIHNRNVLIDLTKGVQFMNEVIEMVIRAFEEAMEDGPLAREPCMKLKVKIVDAELHEDPVHRGPAQIIPAFKWGIRQAMLLANTTLYEPKQIIRIDVPYELVGDVINELQRRRSQILEVKEESGAGIIIAKIPVSESFGLDAALKSVTSGRAFYSILEVTYEELPQELFEKTVLSIRKRKGLKEEIPKPEIEAS